MAALEAAGLKAGQLGQALGRHFSLRDLIKWCHRMQVTLRLMHRCLVDCLLPVPA